MSNLKFCIKFKVVIPHVGHPLYDKFNEKQIEVTDKKQIVIKDKQGTFIRQENDLIPIKFLTILDTGISDVFSFEQFMLYITDNNLRLPLKIEYSDFFRGTRNKGDLIFVSDIKDLAVVTQHAGQNRLVISKLKHSIFQVRGKDHVKTV